MSNLANAINSTFLEPMKELDLSFQLIPKKIVFLSNLLTLQHCGKYIKLKSLSGSKAPGPGAIPNFVYKEFAEILACLISNVINRSVSHQSLPSLWKLQTLFQFQKNRLLRLILINTLHQFRLPVVSQK